jgi:hypothetical protein
MATRAGVVMHADSLMAYLRRSFEYAAEVVCRKTAKKTKPGLIHAKGAPFRGGLNRTGINEFAYRVGVFGFLERGDRIRILQYVVLNQRAAGRRAVCTRTSMRAKQRCLKESALVGVPVCCSLSLMARSRSQWWNNRAPISPPNGCCNWAACCAAAPGTAVIWAVPGV